MNYFRSELNYQEVLDYLYAQLPMFTRIGAAAFKKDLTNTIALCNVLQNPQREFKSIHIAGTNGKGSTSHGLAAILQEAGYKTGLYTSPHLKDFRERIRINGEMISQEEVIAFVEMYKSAFDEIQPSFFEWTVALCFHHFAKHKIDIAVIETGLGGRLDSTNVITPELSVITNIGFDHTDLLGNTLAKIAVEKAGIIKQNIPVVIGEKHEETLPVFLQKAKEKNAPIIFAEEKTPITNSRFENGNMLFEANGIPFETDLGGYYQQKNMATVLGCIEPLQQAGFRINKNHIREALKSIKVKTGLQGRWQILSQNPITVCDTAHNEAGLSYVLEQIKNIKKNKLHVVFGVVRDKDVSKILAMLPKDAKYYFCQANLPRALPASELQNLANSIGLSGMAFESVAEALSVAQKKANKDDMIFIGGSTFVVAEII